MTVDFSTTLFWTEKLVAFALVFQSLELIALRKKIQAIWQKNILPAQILRLFCCLGAFVSPDPFFCLGMLLGSYLTFRMFDGPFNGGSDSMTFNILFCLSIARLFPSAGWLGQLAMGYLALQLVMSYFIAGLAKIRKSNWRSGLALKHLLSSAFYDISGRFGALALKPSQWKILALLMIGFELIFPLALINLSSAISLLALAMIFHLVNFWVLGLNRFVFAWLAAYPALLWLAGLPKFT